MEHVAGYNRMVKMRYSWRNPLYVVYKIVNASNGKTYTGCTLKPDTRMRNHFNNLHHGKHNNLQLQADFICGNKFSVLIVRRIRRKYIALAAEMQNIDKNTYNIIKPNQILEEEKIRA